MDSWVVFMRRAAPLAVLTGVLLPGLATAMAARVLDPRRDPGAIVMRIDSERGLCTNGLDDDDDKRVDCADADCRTDVACREPAHCADGVDNDLDGLIDCADTSDCCGSAACLGSPLCPERPCDDGIDNDGDGPVDCADSDCASGPCLEHLNCADGRDNDRDGLVDCRDTADCCGSASCIGSPDCPFEDCANGTDDDGDGLLDCEDPDCPCDEGYGQCEDGIDNDTDGLVDCADPGCSGDPACDEFGHCTDGIDNDGDGSTDCSDRSDCCADLACEGAPGCPELTCDDGIDNDGDGRIDCRDTDCRSHPDCRESLHCADGLDNDFDGRTDCADLSDCCRAPECTGAPGCPELACANGLDDDADGFIDCADSDCQDDPACACDDDASCEEPDGVLFPPTTDCQLVSAETCEGAYFLHVALAAGRRYTFTLCPSRCPGAGAEFDSRLQLFHHEGYTAASNDGACGDDAEIRYTTDPVDGAGLYCLRVSNDGGGRGFTLGWFVDCVLPTSLTVFPGAGATDDPLCQRPQVFVAAVDGTGAYDWSWTITPPPGGFASPTAGSGRGDIGFFEFQSMLSGTGRYDVRIEARNACGTVATTQAFDLEDHAGPSAVAIAEPAACSIRLARDDHAFMPPCGAPCDAGVLSASGDFFDVFLRCGDGAPTIRTGALHPATLAAGMPLDVLYGGAAGQPGSSEVAWRVHDAARTLANPDGGVACMFDPPDTPDEPQSIGIAHEWTVELRPTLSLFLREEIVTFGTSIENAGVRISLEATNLAASSDRTIMGLRWLLDHRHGADDGPLLVSVQCDPPSESAPLATEHDLLPGEISDLYRIANDDGTPVFSITGSTSQLPGFAGTRRPDRLAFVGWERARRAPWDHVVSEGDPAPDDDSAVMIWMGLTPDSGFVLAPGESVSRTVVLTAAPAATGCGRIRDGDRVDTVATICPGECARIGAIASDGCGPASVTLVSRSTGAPDCPLPPCTAPFFVPGRYDYEWEVEDEAGLVTGARSTIIVRDATDPECNQPPTCEPASVVMTSCRVASLEDATVEDPDGDAIAWTWIPSRPEVTISPSSGILPAGSGPRVLPTVIATLADSVPACDEKAMATLRLDDGQGGLVECTTALSFVDDVPPGIPGVPADDTVSCDAVPPAPPLVARDACDPAPRIAFVETRTDGRCADAYVLRREWTATDACGNTFVAAQQLDVIDDVPPEIPGAPADETVPCDAVPPAPVLSARDACDPAPTISFTEETRPGRCPGEWLLVRSWLAEDRCANQALHEQIVSVVDVEPPVVQEGTDVLACVWPPNHRMACFSRDDFAPVVSDACSGPVTWRFADCASSQPPNDIGDGNTAADCDVAADGSTLCVRAERQGPRRAGRHYGVRIIATDACGNDSDPVGIGTIWIPHDRRAHHACRRPDR